MIPPKRNSVGSNDCGGCHKKGKAGDKWIKCDNSDCNLWFHATCVDMSDAVYDFFANTNALYFCKSCQDPVRTKLTLVDSIINKQEKMESVIASLVSRMDAFDALQKSVATGNSGTVDNANFAGIIQSAVDEAILKQKKKDNLVCVGLPEKHTDGSPVDEKGVFQNIASSINVDPDAIKEVFRHGSQRTDGKPRITKIIFTDRSVRQSFLTKYNTIKTGNELLKRTFVRPDMTPNELLADKKLRDELFNRRHNGEDNIFIKNGKIISRNRN